MKRIALCLLVLSCILFVQTNCSKKEKACTDVPVEKEEAAILKYIAENGITATRHSSGIYYQVEEPGSGIAPSNTSKVTINYVGKLLDNTICDSARNKEWQMSGLLTGFQVGLPLIKKGGKIKLILPSSFAYGCMSIKDDNNNVRVPANSVLIFDIELLNVI